MYSHTVPAYFANIGSLVTTEAPFKPGINPSRGRRDIYRSGWQHVGGCGHLQLEGPLPR